MLRALVLMVVVSTMFALAGALLGLIAFWILAI